LSYLTILSRSLAESRHLPVVSGLGCLLIVLTACGRVEPPVSAATADVVLKAETELVTDVVPRNTTLEKLLGDHGLAPDTVHRLIAAAQSVFDPRRLRATQPFEIERTLDGRFRRFDYEIDADSFLHISDSATSPGELTASILPIPKQREQATATGEIGGETPSLFEAMEAAGERPELTMAMADIFAGEIDFNTELQPDDRFSLAFEKFVREGRPATYGAIEAAEFENAGRVLRAIRFTPAGGKPGYYDEQGRSLRRFFLRSPLKFEPRITSGFSRRRFHPVLKTSRPHLGVDYGAPVGAPVVAVASGTVVSATYDNANGRMVRLRHGSGYETYYLHLSAYGPGIRAGARVDQGQTIGKVGATGLATGPHLDYRVRKNGVFVNPEREHANMPPGEPIPPADRDAFDAHRDAALDRLARALTAPAVPPTL
jgi:murein DD-endopeptidase MepM/ murein hydrolase activator NlpD